MVRANGNEKEKRSKKQDGTIESIRCNMVERTIGRISQEKSKPITRGTWTTRTTT